MQQVICIQEGRAEKTFIEANPYYKNIKRQDLNLPGRGLKIEDDGNY